MTVRFGGNFLAGLLIALALIGCGGSSSPPFHPPPVDPPVAVGPIDAMGPLAAEGRYLVRPDGEVQLLVGSHAGWELQCGDAWEPTPKCFDVDRFIDDLENWGHNTLRLWTVEHTLYNIGERGAKDVMRPMAWARTGPGKALDGEPKFDLLIPNPAYHGVLKRRVETLRARGMYAIVMLFQGVSYDVDIGPEFDTWKTLVWNPANNVQGYALERPGWEAHRKTSGPIWEAQRVYLRDIVRTLEGLPNVLLEVANEDKNGSIEWQAAVITELRQIMKEELGHTPWPIGATFRQGNGTNGELVQSGADWISPKAPRGVNQFARWAPTGNVPNILDTDHFWIYVMKGGNNDDVDPRAHLLPEMAFEQGAGGFLHLDRPGVYLGRQGPKHPRLHADQMPMRKAMGEAIQ